MCGCRYVSLAIEKRVRRRIADRHREYEQRARNHRRTGDWYVEISAAHTDDKADNNADQELHELLRQLREFEKKLRAKAVCHNSLSAAEPIPTPYLMRDIMGNKSARQSRVSISRDVCDSARDDLASMICRAKLREGVVSSAHQTSNGKT